MNASAPVPDDHPLMIAWKSYQATEDYANSYKWATAAIELAVIPPPKDPTANRMTKDGYRRFVEGSLWAAFMAGFNTRAPSVDSGVSLKDAAQSSELLRLREALEKLTHDCMANDFNEHWESYKNARTALAGKGE